MLSILFQLNWIPHKCCLKMTLDRLRAMKKDSLLFCDRFQNVIKFIESWTDLSNEHPVRSTNIISISLLIIKAYNSYRMFDFPSINYDFQHSFKIDFEWKAGSSKQSPEVYDFVSFKNCSAGQAALNKISTKEGCESKLDGLGLLEKAWLWKCWTAVVINESRSKCIQDLYKKAFLSDGWESR